MKKRFLTLFLLYLILTNITTVFAASQVSSATPPSSFENMESLELSADSAILIDASTGTILYEKNKDKKQYPASITKLMTVLLALENGNLEDTMTFSEEAVFGIERNSSHIAIDVGEQITLLQGLYAIMLQSANEVSLGVAEYIDGSKEAFAARMNSRAHELGCLNTNFVNPNGLHDDNHYTTAYDMALIARELLKFDFFRELMATTYYEIPPTNKQSETRYLYGQHKMINQNTQYYYEGCEGGKTGFTNEALNTLVTYAKKGDTELIAVVLHDAGAGTYVDTKILFDYGFDHFETIKAFSADTYSDDKAVLQDYKKKTYDAGDVVLKAESDIYATVKKGADNAVTTNILCDSTFPVPVEEGAVLGTIEAYSGDKFLGKTNIIAANSVGGFSEEELSKKASSQIGSLVFHTVKLIGLGLLLLFALIYVGGNIYYEQKRRKRRRRFKQKYRSDDV